MYTHAHTRTHIHTRTHTHIHTHIHTNTHTHIHSPPDGPGQLRRAVLHPSLDCQWPLDQHRAAVCLWSDHNEQPGPPCVSGLWYAAQSGEASAKKNVCFCYGSTRPLSQVRCRRLSRRSLGFRVGQNHVCIGLARTIHIRCTYGISCRDFIKYTVIYGVYIRFWPTLHFTQTLKHVPAPASTHTIHTLMAWHIACCKDSHPHNYALGCIICQRGSTSVVDRARLVDIGLCWCIKVRKPFSETCAD